MYKNSHKIAVLMATYNGGQYIAEQMESLFRQSCEDFHLYIHDDGSSDNTLNIVQDFTEKHPDQITLIEDSKKHRGAASSFMFLLESVESKYYMFCDQDDVWMDFKIARSLEQIQAEELANSVEMPVLVFSDLRVVDESLSPIKQSFNADLKLDLFKRHPNMLWVRHIATGCTMMFNDTAKKVALPLSPWASMHDEWVTLCVYKSKGIISIMDEATILYRQHGNNTLGAEQAALSARERAIKPQGRSEFFALAKLLRKEFGISFPRFVLYKILYSWLR